MMTLVVILGGDALFFVVPCRMDEIVHVSESTLAIVKRALLDHDTLSNYRGELQLIFGDEWVTMVTRHLQHHPVSWLQDPVAMLRGWGESCSA